MRNTSQIPNSLSCSIDEQGPLVRQANLKLKNLGFSKMAKRALDDPCAASLQQAPTRLTSLGSSGTIVDSFAIPIYQLKTAYRI